MSDVGGKNAEDSLSAKRSRSDREGEKDKHASKNFALLKKEGQITGGGLSPPWCGGAPGEVRGKSGSRILSKIRLIVYKRKG